MLKITKVVTTCLFILNSVICLHSQSLTKFSGMVFFDYYYNLSTNTSYKNDMHGFQFRRIFFTGDFDVSNRLSARLRIESDGTNFKDEKKLGAYMKDAYFLYNTSNIQFYAGLIPTPPIEIEEKYWAYRSVEKIQSDLRGLVATRDLGLAVKSNNSNLPINWIAMFGNNSSHGEETDKYKKLYLHSNIAFDKNFVMAIDLNFANDHQNKNFYYTRLGFFFPDLIERTLTSGFTIVNTIKNNNSGKDIVSLGSSFFSSLSLKSDIKTFIRVDLIDFNFDIINDMEYSLILGLDYKIDKNLNLIPNLYYNVYENLNNKSDLVFKITTSYQF